MQAFKEGERDPVSDLFGEYSPDPVETGKYWRGCAAPLGGIYVAWIDENRFLNVSTFIGTYLFCVVCDYLLTLVWEPVSRRIFGNIDTYGASLLYVLFYLLILAAILPGTFQAAPQADGEDKPNAAPAAYGPYIHQPCILPADLSF